MTGARRFFSLAGNTQRITARRDPPPAVFGVAQAGGALRAPPGAEGGDCRPAATNLVVLFPDDPGELPARGAPGGGGSSDKRNRLDEFLSRRSFRTAQRAGLDRERSDVLSLLLGSSPPLRRGGLMERPGSAGTSWSRCFRRRGQPRTRPRTALRVGVRTPATHHPPVNFERTESDAARGTDGLLDCTIKGEGRCGCGPLILDHRRRRGGGGGRREIESWGGYRIRARGIAVPSIARDPFFFREEPLRDPTIQGTLGAISLRGGRPTAIHGLRSRRRTPCNCGGFVRPVRDCVGSFARFSSGRKFCAPAKDGAPSSQGSENINDRSDNGCRWWCSRGSCFRAPAAVPAKGGRGASAGPSCQPQRSANEAPGRSRSRPVSRRSRCGPRASQAGATRVSDERAHRLGLAVALKVRGGFAFCRDGRRGTDDEQAASEGSRSARVREN